MSKVSVWECPNCGGTELVEVGPEERRCAYCGSVVSQQARLRCPRCGLDNERVAHYCNQCGLALTKWMAPERPKRDLAVISIVATVENIVLEKGAYGKQAGVDQPRPAPT